MISMNDNTNKISNILQQVRLLKNKYDELAAVTGEDFNIFSILRIKRKEVKTHTPMLAELLDPHGSHRQRAAFLKLFLEICVKQEERSNKQQETAFYNKPETYRVRSEERTDQGQFDILLEKEKEACIVIENKIDADDLDSQLNRYYQDARKRFSGSQIKLIYLTLDGSPPSKKSLKAVDGQGNDLSIDDVILISYREHIIKWLEVCMKLKGIQRIAPIREILFQYRDLLNELTGQPTNTRYSMELKDILVRDKNYVLIPDLEDMILEFKVHLQYKFWEELKKQILDLPKVDDWHKTQDDQHDPSVVNNIRNFYLWKTQRYLCQRFHLGTVWEQYEIALSTGIEYGASAKVDYIYFGFILFENGTQVDYCLDKRFNELADKLDNGFTRDENKWLVWKHPEREIGFPVKYPSPVVDDLLNHNKRGEVVKEFVSEIRGAINRLKKNLT